MLCYEILYFQMETLPIKWNSMLLLSEDAWRKKTMDLLTRSNNNNNNSNKFTCDDGDIRC